MKNLVISIILFLSFVHFSQSQSPDEWSFEILENEVKVGDTVTLKVEVTLDYTWQLYSTDQNPDVGPTPTQIKFETHTSYQLIGDLTPEGVRQKFDPTWPGIVRYFEDKAIFYQKVRILSGKPIIRGTYAYQVCTTLDGKCINGEEEFEFIGTKSIFNPSKIQNNQLGDIYPALRIGDEIPNYEFTKLVNHQSSSAKLTEFKGQSMILDFWFSGCAPCIASWPKLLELQKKYHDRVQIILVNPLEDVQDVLDFILKRKENANTNMTLPTFCKGSRIEELFPVTSYPTTVWIDENSVVRHIADGSSISDRNIREFLDRGTIQAENRILKKNAAVIYEKPFYIGGNVSDGEEMMWYSTVSRYNHNLRPAIGIFASEEPGYFITIANSSIIRMIKLLFNESNNFLDGELFDNRIVLDMPAPDRLKSGIDGVYQSQNLYSYQLFSKEPTTIAKLKEIAHSDIENYFGIDIEWQKRYKECLVLSSMDTTRISYSKGEAELFINESKVVFNKIKVESLIRKIKTKYQASPFPIVNETGFVGDLGKFSAELNIEDYESFDKALERFGMRFKVEKREIDVLVVKEKEGYQHIERSLTEDEKIANREVNFKRLLRKIYNSDNVNEDAIPIVEFVDEYYSDDWKSLNSYASAFYEVKGITDEGLLDKALSWAKKSISMESNYYNWNTYAGLLYKMDKVEEALNAAKKAVTIAYQNEIDPIKTEQLIKKIQERIN